MFVEFRKKCKAKLVGIFGGACMICGYDKCHRSLQFHHLIPENKSFTISSWRKIISYSKLIEEVKKCILVCANCHGEIEAGLISAEGINTDLIIVNLEKERIGNESKKIRKFYKKDCPVCNKSFEAILDRIIYCSVECMAFERRKVERPSKEELNNLIWLLPMSKISEQYGVSDKAVSKWIKNYGLQKPPRGFFVKRIRLTGEASVR